MFVELICRSHYSFLSGASDPAELVLQAVSLGMQALALTDLNGVYGIVKAYHAANQEGVGAGGSRRRHFQLIVGCELSLVDHPPLVLIASDRKAYGALCQLLTAFHAGHEKGQGRLTLQEFLSFTAQHESSAAGWFVLVKHTTHSQLAILKSVFGARVFLAFCRYLDGLDQSRTETLLAASRLYDLRLVATNDVYYHHPERKPLQDAVTCIRHGVSLQTAGKLIFKNNERYLKSPQQMAELFYDFPQALRQTLDIAEACVFSLSQLSYQYPSELIPAGHTQQSYLAEQVMLGAHQIYRGVIHPDVAALIRKELELIAEKNYASYFLTIFDIVNFAKQRGILCQGRGSAANSITCYCLGITVIDPLEMNLLFERFMSRERDEPPDIDVDFEHERREEVIQYVYERYGRDRAAMVAAVRTYRSRSAFLELSQAFGVPVGVLSADRLSRDFPAKANHHRPLIERLAGQLHGVPRHLSIHSGGFTLSHAPITETVPVEPARMARRTIVQWDKNDLEIVGLLKLDLLSLGFLTALHRCLDLLGIKWAELPSEDVATYDMICRAETEGCFQIESRAQRAILPRTLPRTFYDLVVQVAIVRPGPSAGDMIKPYLQRREAARRGQPYVSPHPQLEPILGRTYGIPIFQEQMMKVAMVQAGFSPGEADQLRRLIADTRSPEKMLLMGEKLYQGLINSGLSAEWASELFGYFKGYAHYGFPESHAASFAKIAYASAYLKCHHPAEFLIALINSQPMGFYSIDTLIHGAQRQGVEVRAIDPHASSWDATLEAPGVVRMGFRNVRKIRRQDVCGEQNQTTLALPQSSSAGRFSPNERGGGVGGGEAARAGEQQQAESSSQKVLQHCFRVLEFERQRARFTDFYDFMRRTRFSQDVLERLILGDVFACFGHDQRHTLWQALAYRQTLQGVIHPSWEQLSFEGLRQRQHQHPQQQQGAHPGRPQTQQSASNSPPAGTGLARLQTFAPMSRLAEVRAEERAFGYSVKGNVMSALRPMLPPDALYHSSQSLKTLRSGTEVDFLGILKIKQRPPTAKGVTFLTFEDEWGSVDGIIPVDFFERLQRELPYGLEPGRVFAVRGQLQKRGQLVSLLLKDMRCFVMPEEVS